MAKHTTLIDYEALPDPANPLPGREPNEPWIDFARRHLRATKAEIALAVHDRGGWVRRYGTWPGNGYLRTLEIQQARWEKDIARAEAAA